MSEYDGSIKFDTKIDTAGIQAGVKSLKPTIASAFASMRDVMQGPVAIGKQIISTMQAVGVQVEKLESAWAAQEEAIAVLNSTLKATGANAWTSSEALQDMASEFQGFTKYGDETVTAMQTVLLGFKNIKGDNFKEASLQILNMATVMKMDLTSAAQAVGKALDDPINGIDSLSRQGFKFSKEQKELLKSLVQTGETAKAQKIILDELATTYGGAAAAAGETGSAVKIKLANAVGDLNEELGRAITDRLKPFREMLLGIVNDLQKSAKSFNDLKDAESRASNGSASLSDKLLIARDKLKALTNEADLSVGPMADSIRDQIKYQEIYIKKLEERLEAEKAGNKLIAEQAAKKADTDAKNAKLENEKNDFLKKRNAIEEEYSDSIEKINRLETEGRLTSEQANEQRLSATESNITALNDLYQTDAGNSPVTLALLRERIAAYKAQAEAIKENAESVAFAKKAQEDLDEFEKDYQKRKTTFAEKWNDKQKMLTKETIAEERDRMVEEAILTEQSEEMILSIKKYYVDLEAEYEKKKAEEVAEKWASAFTKTGSALGSISGDSSSIFSGLGQTGAGIAKLVATQGSTGYEDLLAGLSSLASESDLESFDELQEKLDDFASSLLDALGPVLDYLIETFSSMLDVITPKLDILAPILDIITALTKAMEQFSFLAVVLQVALGVLSAIVKAVSDAIIWLYNNIVVPVYNAINTVFNKIYNAFAGFINGILSMIDNIPFVDISYRVGYRDESYGNLSEYSAASSSVSDFADELEDANDELEENRSLFRKASNAASAYDSVLSGVVESVSSFYESLQDIGSDISETLVDSLIDGLDGDDFLYALEEYITEAVIKAAVFTDSFMAEVSEIGTALAQAIASGADSNTINDLKNRLSSLYATAQAAAQAASSLVSAAFGSYAVGTLNVNGDQLANIHDSEMILPAGISEEARKAGVYIGPMSGAMGLSSQSINVNVLGALDVDGEKLGEIAFRYQDSLVGAAYGA